MWCTYCKKKMKYDQIWKILFILLFDRGLIWFEFLVVLQVQLSAQLTSNKQTNKTNKELGVTSFIQQYFGHLCHNNLCVTFFLPVYVDFLEETGNFRTLNNAICLFVCLWFYAAFNIISVILCTAIGYLILFLCF